MEEKMSIYKKTSTYGITKGFRAIYANTKQGGEVAILTQHPDGLCSGCMLVGKCKSETFRKILKDLKKYVLPTDWPRVLHLLIIARRIAQR